MQSKVFAKACLLIACGAAALLAQDVPSRQPIPAPLGVINDVDVLVTNVRLEKLDNPPKREIKFERAEEPVKQQLSRFDPKLVEQKYVAIIRVGLPQDYTGSRYLVESDAEFPLQFWGSTFFLRPNASRGRIADNVPPSENLKRMLKVIPDDRQPGLAEAEFFTSTAIQEGFLLTDSVYSSGRVIESQFRILALSPELAELRAEAFLTLLDLGFSRPIQMAIFKKRGPLEDELRVARKLLAAEEAQVTDLRRALDSFADFTPEMLPGLRVQQLQLDVDLAGVKARIAACERLLGVAGIKPSRQQQLEDAKIAAEIELSGIEARRAKSEEFVAKVKKKIDLTAGYLTEQGERNDASKTCRSLELRIRSLDQEIQFYSPLPLVDGKVIIAPLEWTQ